MKISDEERLIKSNTKLVDENRYLKVDKEVLEKDIKILMNLISKNQCFMDDKEIEVFEKYYYMIRG